MTASNYDTTEQHQAMNMWRRWLKAMQIYEVRIKCLVSSTSKERIEQEFKDFLEHEQAIELEPDSKIEDCIEVYST